MNRFVAAAAALLVSSPFLGCSSAPGESPDPAADESSTEQAQTVDGCRWICPKCMNDPVPCMGKCSLDCGPERCGDRFCPSGQVCSAGVCAGD